MVYVIKFLKSTILDTGYLRMTTIEARSQYRYSQRVPKL